MVVGDAGIPVPGGGGEGGGKRGAYLFLLKANQGEALEWALEVFKGMEERLPGETEAAWGWCGTGGVDLPGLGFSPSARGAFGLSGCRQVVRVEREVVHKRTGEVRRTVSYALTQPGPGGGGREAAWELLLSRWEVENRSFWVRDVLFREDACQVRGVGAQVLAALRSLSGVPATPRGGAEEGHAPACSESG